jgi:hypothetical protein
MTRIPHHLLRTSACLTGGLLAVSLILVAAVGSAVLAAGLTLFRCLAPLPSRASDIRAARRAPVRTQPAPRAEPAV